MSKRGNYTGGSTVFGPGSSWFGRGENEPSEEDVDLQNLRSELARLDTLKRLESDRKSQIFGKKRRKNIDWTEESKVKIAKEKALLRAQQKALEDWERIFVPKNGDRECPIFCV